MDVLVTGGTGRLGQRLLGPLQAAGHAVRQMSRRGTGPGGVRGDLATGRGPAGGARRRRDDRARRQRPARRPLAVRRRRHPATGRRPSTASRLQHLVYVSIVGVDRIPYGYYRAKFAAEQVLLASGLPVTLLRVTQFHDFVDFLLDTARRGPVLPVPMGWRVQPVDVGEVAAHIVTEVCAAPPAGGVVEFGGPEELSAADLARAWAGGPRPGHPRGRHARAGQAEHRVPGRRRAALRRRPGTPDVRPAPDRLTAALLPVTAAERHLPGAASDTRRRTVGGPA